jgi:hypothetical protein
MMNEPGELNGLTDNSAARRLWLLHNALRCLPFDRAIELARAAEAFITGSAAENRADDIRIDAEVPVARGLEPTQQLMTEISGKLLGVEEPIAKKSTRLALPTERRDQLLDRLAEDAKNAELAAEFGITSKQVQGIRMGCAREIAKRRDQLTRKPMQPDRASPQTARIEDIVRYLRQQDDVVVAQEKGEFLVNGRFRMPFEDLIARANRIRRRQGQPAFELPGGETGHPQTNSSANGHPLFWDKPMSSQPSSYPGSQRRKERVPEGA